VSEQGCPDSRDSKRARGGAAAVGDRVSGERRRTTRRQASRVGRAEVLRPPECRPRARDDVSRGWGQGARDVFKHRRSFLESRQSCDLAAGKKKRSDVPRISRRHATTTRAQQARVRATTPTTLHRPPPRRWPRSPRTSRPTLA
jgi:hypothetical protein